MSQVFGEHKDGPPGQAKDRTVDTGSANPGRCDSRSSRKAPLRKVPLLWHDRLFVPRCALYTEAALTGSRPLSRCQPLRALTPRKHV